MSRWSLTASHKHSDAQPVSEQWPPLKANTAFPFFFPHPCFTAECDIILYGISFHQCGSAGPAVSPLNLSPASSPLAPGAMPWKLPLFLVQQMMSLCFSPSNTMNLEASHSWFCVWKLRTYRQARQRVCPFSYFLLWAPPYHYPQSQAKKNAWPKLLSYPIHIKIELLFHAKRGIFPSCFVSLLLLLHDVAK